MSTQKESRDRLYRIWYGMLTRCNNTKSKDYKRYGARGIKVCFRSFLEFYAWAISNGYADNLTIDRIDNDGNYSADNCRWVTAKEQSNNRRSNKLITYNGETHTVTQWAEIYGLSVDSLFKRIEIYGFSFEEAIKTPCEKRERKITYKGKTQNLKQWAEELRIPYYALRSRLNKLHWTVSKAFETPYSSFFWDRGKKND